MSIQVPLLVIDRRRVSVSLHCSRTRRVRTLKVRWRLYYEFMCFDVPKVVQSPECGHGHDEVSRNGRDMKIDTLEAYIWISEVFWVKSGFYWSIGGVTGTPGKYWALVGLRGERGQQPRRWRAPSIVYASGHILAVLR